MGKTYKRWQNIKYTATGKPFVIKYGKRFYLDDCMRTNYCMEKKGYMKYNGFTIHATFNSMPVLGIHINDGGDKAITIYLDDKEGVTTYE